MTLAHDALSIVIREHKGKLESFEADAMGRLMAADRVERRMRTAIGQLTYGPTIEDVIIQMEHQAIGRWRALVPEYVPLEMQKGLVTGIPENRSRTRKVQWAFREAICERLQASVFERLGQVQRMVTAYYSSISHGFPRGMQPTNTTMQIMNYLHTPNGVLTIVTIRLALVRKIQRIAPELGNSSQEATTENCGGMLVEIVADLTGRAGDNDNTYRDVLIGRTLNHIWVDRLNDEYSGNTYVDEAEDAQNGESSDSMDEYEESDTEDEATQ